MIEEEEKESWQCKDCTCENCTCTEENKCESCECTNTDAA